MADLVTSQTLYSNNHRALYVFTNVSDGTGESAVAKVDISALPGAPTAVRIMRVIYSIAGMAVKIGFDHTADDFVLVIEGHDEIDLRAEGGIPDPASTGGTGDIVFTTVGHTSGDTYTIVLELYYS